MKAFQLLAFIVFADTVMDGSRMRAVCHQPAGTKSVSPACSRHRAATARVEQRKPDQIRMLDIRHRGLVGFDTLFRIQPGALVG